MSTVVDFKEAALDANIRRILSGTYPEVDEDRRKGYAEEGVALIRKESVKRRSL